MGSNIMYCHLRRLLNIISLASSPPSKHFISLVPKLSHVHAIIDDLGTHGGSSLSTAYPYGYKGHQLLHVHVGEPRYKANTLNWRRQMHYGGPLDLHSLMHFMYCTVTLQSCLVLG